MHWVKLALYRIWRLRRVLAIELAAPWAAIWLVGRWEPAFAAILPMLLDGGAVLQYSAFVIAAAVLFPTGAVNGLVLVGAFTGVIFIMPAIWRETAPGGAAEGAFLETAVLATLLAWVAAHLAIWALSRVAWPGEHQTDATIRVDLPAPEVFDRLRLDETEAPLNEAIRRVAADPEQPGRLHAHYHGGATLISDIVHEGEMKQTTVTELGRAREVYNLEVTRDGDGARLREVSRTTGFGLPEAVGFWLKDFLADRQIYLRDRLEGRRSLAVHATLARALRKPRLMQRLFGRSKG